MLLCSIRATVTALLKICWLVKEDMKSDHPILTSSFFYSDHLHHSYIHDTIVEVSQQKLFSWKCSVTWLETLDAPSVAILIMLHLFITFDAADHPTVLRYFEFSFGIEKKYLTWVYKVLTHRHNSMCFSCQRITGCI